MRINLSFINKAETVNEDKVIKLTIPKDRLRSDVIVARFSYDTNTDECTIIGVE